MHTDRLTKLADYLDTVDAARFNLSSWFETTVDQDGNSPCGAVACAVGHACLMPEFNAAGLTRDAEPDNPVYNHGCPVYRPNPDSDLEHRSWSAVREFFGLTGHQDDYLFYDGSYPDKTRTTPAQVAARIRDVVANGFPESVVV